MVAPSKKEISLLPSAENSNSFVSRALKWLTTVGRFVIVFTELIVISAFISRFWLDRKNSDLSEVIRQQKAILESTQDFEKEFLSLQQRLNVIKSAYASKTDHSVYLASLVESTPPLVYFDNLSLEQVNDKTTSLVFAYTENEEALVEFITNLTINPNIGSVNVKSIEKKAKESRYIMNIEVIFK